ncbi:MAG: DUF2075 domain-containing protein [Pontimonas sp.]|nr:DUF2075 domain-containing protein [Pontimonas sp.]
MTNFKIERLPFDADAISVWSRTDERHTNWPVVYTISADDEIYVGETLSVASRLQQHLTAEERKVLTKVRIVFSDTFNKSVCLDLESHLIRYFHADGALKVQNRNAGITDADYFNRDEYRRSFDELFDELLKEGLLTRSVPDIVNSNLFKFSPFKALNGDQAAAVDQILEIFFEDMGSGGGRSLVVQGDPGTGKTIVAIYLMKLLIDIQKSGPDEAMDQDTLFAEFFSPEFRALLTDFRVGLVIPQQSLRKTVQAVFSKTPGLHKSMVMNPFDVGESELPFDLLIVDEAHRLGQRSNQPSAALNSKFSAINKALFGDDRDDITQLDWIKAQSRHQLYLIDSAQSIKPADLPSDILNEVISGAKSQEGFFHLASQMRVNGGHDYVNYIGALVKAEAPVAPRFGDYEFRFFDDVASMRDAIVQKDAEAGLSRLVAGFAWPWVSRNDPTAPDIELDGVKFFWNRTATDWINSPTSLEEVGSIHTVQGYDLNYAGVIIGSDLGYDPLEKKMVFYRENYHDKKGKENNPKLGIVYSNDDLLEYVSNIYRVLLTRGIRGTYVYACDPGLRGYLRALIPSKI